jgi:hypothetical protein
MKNWKVLMVISITLLALTSLGSAGEILYNGIELPEQWPPDYGAISRDPMPVPYLKNPPEVIPIDVGRQLFVDDFLIETTMLQRTFHQPEYCKENPVIERGNPGESNKFGSYAKTFSGGVCYDPADKLFKLWYTGARPHSTRYATSKDGIHWEKPELDKNPEERFKYFASENPHPVERRSPSGNTWDDSGWSYIYRSSPDGIHWSEPKEKVDIWGDRSTAFYNPFRKMWVLSQRTEGPVEDRARSYLEAATISEMMKEVTFNGPRIELEDGKEKIYRGEAAGKSVNWTGANDLDVRHTDSRFSHIAPHLYNLDASPYESIMIGQFSIWQGPTNRDCGPLHLQKRNDIMLGFSRDGFHWDRSYRGRFISSSWEEKSWRFGNVQSCASGPVIVGDKLYFYFCGYEKPREGGEWDKDGSTGLAMLRRDGFASMDAGTNTETLTTRPVTFKGNHLFVNVDCPEGELKVEVLGKDGKVIAPFTVANCTPISSDKTLVKVNWKDENLSVLAGKPVRFRFHLENGSLYSFWVSPDKSGASHGYIGAGGLGFTGPTDTVGQSK